MGIIRDYLNEKAGKLLKIDDKEFIGIGGYVAGVRLKDDITYTCNVTTNTVEDGSEVNDHIINNPIIINIEGEVGDLEKIPDPILQAYKKVMREAGVVTKYLPKRTQSQISKLNSYVLKANDILNKVDSIIDDGMQIYRLFKPLETKKETVKFFEHFEKLHNTKQLIDVDMRFKTYRNMRIISFTITNDGGNYVGYSMTLQEVRFAKLKVENSGKYIKKSSGATKSQTKKANNKGDVTTKKAPEAKKSSLLKTITG